MYSIKPCNEGHSMCGMLSKRPADIPPLPLWIPCQLLCRVTDICMHWLHAWSPSLFNSTAQLLSSALVGSSLTIPTVDIWNCYIWTWIAAKNDFAKKKPRCGVVLSGLEMTFDRLRKILDISLTRLYRYSRVYKSTGYIRYSAYYGFTSCSATFDQY